MIGSCRVLAHWATAPRWWWVHLDFPGVQFGCNLGDGPGHPSTANRVAMWVQQCGPVQYGGSDPVVISQGMRVLPLQNSAVPLPSRTMYTRERASFGDRLPP